ncbi:MAG TPA: quinone oxidoreductase [Marmoricola sp.]|nr:quinone oxidoreductase [Marmoricola sp.]
MHGLLVSQHGGPEVYAWTEVPTPAPGPGQIQVKVSVAGVNFLDAYQRRGGTPVAAPFVAGVEGVGTVTEIGEGVADFSLGQRVGWLTGCQGAFAEYAVVAADSAVPIPDEVDDQAAAAVLLQGVTAHYLAVDTYPIQPGDAVLIHAAAGGVGLLLTQIAKLRGATVIATVSTPAKAELARWAGADHVIGYDDVAAQARALTGGEGVAAAYDGVGLTTFEGSLASLRTRGILVSFGAASGHPPLLEIPRLNPMGSLYVTRPTAVHYTRTPQELRRRTDDLFGWLASEDLKLTIGGRYPVTDAAAAFTALESRATTGKLLLLVG